MRWTRLAALAMFAVIVAAAGTVGGQAQPADEQPGADPRAAGPSADPELTATAEIRRSFTAPGKVTIAVTNHGPEPVHVTGVELVSPAFAPTGVIDAAVTIPPSDIPRDVPAQYGTGQCPDGIDSVVPSARAVLQVATEDGRSHQIEAGLPHPNDVLDRLLRESCAQQLLDESITLELGDLSTESDGTLTGDLILTRRIDDEPMALYDAAGSVLYDVIAAPPDQPRPVAELPVGTDSVAVEVRIDAERCSGHAVGDAKMPFAFRAWVTVGAAERVATPIPVTDEHKEVLVSMHDRQCSESRGG